MRFRRSPVIPGQVRLITLEFHPPGNCDRISAARRGGGGRYREALQKGLDSSNGSTIHHRTGSAVLPAMIKVPFEQSVSKATSCDPRYAADAYTFLKESLDHTMRAAVKSRGREPGHVSGPELCRGVRDYAVSQFGPMVPTIFEAWGLRSTRDIGEMVFNLISAGAFSKSDSDKPEDFDNVFDFEDAFVKPFLPGRNVRPSDQKPGRPSGGA